MRWIIAQILGNIGYVSDGIWRSAQRWYLYLFLPFLRLKTIINLATSPEKDKQDRFEEKFCKLFKIKYISYDTVGPKYNFDAAFSELLNCSRPVLVHCEGGKDRTGGLIAYYRRKVLGHNWEDIIKDWKIYGIPGEDWLKFLFDDIKSE